MYQWFDCHFPGCDGFTGYFPGQMSRAALAFHHSLGLRDLEAVLLKSDVYHMVLQHSILVQDHLILSQLIH